MDTKTLFSTAFGFLTLLAGIIAVFAILFRLGREKSNKSLWLWVHRISGYLFLAMISFVVVVMFYKVSSAEADFTPRAVAHISFGSVAFALALLKWALVRPFRGQIKLAPVVGLILLVVTFVTVNLSATMAALNPEIAGNTGRGTLTDADLFEIKCSRCHTAAKAFEEDREEDEIRLLVDRMRAKDPSWINEEEADDISVFLISYPDE